MSAPRSHQDEEVTNVFLLALTQCNFENDKTDFMPLRAALKELYQERRLKKGVIASLKFKIEKGHLTQKDFEKMALVFADFNPVQTFKQFCEEVGIVISTHKPIITFKNDDATVAKAFLKSLEANNLIDRAIKLSYLYTWDNTKRILRKNAITLLKEKISSAPENYYYKIKEVFDHYSDLLADLNVSQVFEKFWFEIAGKHSDYERKKESSAPKPHFLGGLPKNHTVPELPSPRHEGTKHLSHSLPTRWVQHPSLLHRNLSKKLAEEATEKSKDKTYTP